MTCHRWTRPDSGFATIWAVGWILVCLSIGWLSLLAAAVVARQHHLDSTADLASIAAATRVQVGSDGCAAAQQVAERNGVELTACGVHDDDVVVTVEDRADLPFGLDGRLMSKARAGPAEVSGEQF